MKTISKSLHQAQEGLKMLQAGPCTTEQFSQLNQKYPNDVVYYIRTLLKVEVKRIKKDGKNFYVLPDLMPEIELVDAKPQEPLPVAVENKPFDPTVDRRYVIPEWEGSPFQLWAKNYCCRNKWRVERSLGDYQDCMGECALQWVLCCQRYGAVVDNAKWLMRLYQLMVMTTFDTISIKDTRNREMYEKLPKNEPAIESEALLFAKLTSASEELKLVVKKMFQAPEEMLEVARKDAISCHPKQFFKTLVKMCGIKEIKAASIANELHNLLGG